MKNEILEILINSNKKLNGILVETDIIQYVDKIIKHANVLTYFIEGELAGFIAYYCNDKNKYKAFLTMLCVANGFEGKGIGKFLLQTSLLNVRELGFKTYSLEVNKNNLTAINLYTNYGFVIVETKDKTFIMKKDVSDVS